MRKLLVMGFISTGLLTGCGGSGNGYGFKESPLWHSTASAKVKQKYFQDQCLGFGFKLNTPEMAQCIQNQTNQSRSEARKGMADAFEQQARAQQAALSRQTTTNCNPNGFGGFRCNSY
jgi:hypothetical protein